MAQGPAPSGTAWLMLAAGSNRQHGGNAGYNDTPDEVYRWDTTVPNHGQVAKGDLVAIWDKRSLLGLSVIEAIDRVSETKSVFRCPNCGGSKIKPRATRTPIYRCHQCTEEFDHPRSSEIEVVASTAHHGTGWVDLAGALGATTLRACCYSPKSQLSMRPLDMVRFEAALDGVGAAGAIRLARSVQRLVHHGHSERLVRVRRGQASFRRAMFDEFGPICALSGETPPDALEAAHLYSYSEVGRHHSSGGILLRRDLHYLFDAGEIAIHPETATIDLRPSLLAFDQYSALQGTIVRVALGAGHRGWLRMHWEQHRSP